MNGQKTPHHSLGDGGGQFSDTHWSVVLNARDEGSAQAAGAMEKLCRTYWHPLYAYIRREGHGPEAAEDLTQEFFVRFLAKDYLQHLRHRDGKFRSFLLTLVKRFLSDERDKARALKRGGGTPTVALDETRAEEIYLGNETHGLNPAQLFDRRWAETVMECALGRLGKEYAEGGKSVLFDQLKDIQPGQHGESTCAEIGARLGLAEGSVKSAVHRLRRRHREILREEIARTVARPAEIDEEIRDLLSILSQ